MRNGLFWLCFGALSGVLGLGSCTKANIIFGQDQVSNGLSNIVVLDSVTPQMSTLFVDSVPTSAKGLALLGGYNDIYFGSISPRSYFELAPPPLTNLDPQAVFDSLTLYLVPNRYYVGDTSLPIDIYAEQIRSQMQFPIYGSQFYNNDSFPVGPVLGQVLNHYILPHQPDTVYIHLDSTLGATWFAQMKAGDPNLVNPNQFLGAFPGIRISAGYGNGTGATPGVIFGYKDSIMVKLWYHIPNLERQENAMTFSFANSQYQFTETRNTPIAPLTEFRRQYSSTVQQIYSSAPGWNHMVYVNPLLGYTSKIQFPYLQQLYQQDTTLRSIIKAQLIVRPILPSFSTAFQLPASMILVYTDYNNQQGVQESAGVLNLDYGGSDTQYTFDITSFLSTLLNDPTAVTYQKGLILMPSAATYFTQLNRLVTGDNLYQSPYTSPTYFQTQVVIYYVSTQNTL